MGQIPLFNERSKKNDDAVCRDFFLTSDEGPYATLADVIIINLGLSADHLLEAESTLKSIALEFSQFPPIAERPPLSHYSRGISTLQALSQCSQNSETRNRAGIELKARIARDPFKKKASQEEKREAAKKAIRKGMSFEAITLLTGYCPKEIQVLAATLSLDEV